MIPVGDFEHGEKLDFYQFRYDHKHPYSCSTTMMNQDFPIRFDKKVCSHDDGDHPSSHQKAEGETIPRMVYCDNSTKPPVVDDPNDNTTYCDLPYEQVLHNACRLFPHSEEVVQIALGLYPTDIAEQGQKVRQPSLKRRKISHGGSSSTCSNNVTVRRVQEEYSLPINIALAGKANDKVLDALISESSEALILPDGSSRSGSLSVALKCNFRCRDGKTIKKLIGANPECVRVCDSKGNNPLHIACSTGASQGIIQEVFQCYPRALIMKNISGNTPLDVAMMSAHLITDRTVDFLTRKSMELNLHDRL